MAQTIKIKRSTNNASPTTLENAELAYSSDSNKLFIGRPGGSTSDVDAIGGKYYTDMLANATSENTASTIVRRDANHQINATVFSTGGATSEDWTTAAGWGDHAYAGYLTTHQDISGKLNKAGDTMTGELLMNSDVKLKDGKKLLLGDAENASIHHTSSSTYFEESGNGNLILKGSNIEIRSAEDELFAQFVENGVSKLYTNGVDSLTTTSNGITVKDSAGNQGTVNGKISTLSNHNADDLGEGSTNKYFTNTRVDSRVDTIFKHSNHSNVSVTEGSNGELLINASAQYGDSDVVTKLTNMGITSAGSQGNQIISLPQLTFNGNTIYSGGTMTLDPSGHDDKTGTVRIRGDLQVDGDTITIDSETVNIKDNEIILNSDLTGAAIDGGIKVNRGSSGADASLAWSETAGAWQVQGNTITHANSTLDGGSF